MIVLVLFTILPTSMLVCLLSTSGNSVRAATFLPAKSFGDRCMRSTAGTWVAGLMFVCESSFVAEGCADLTSSWSAAYRSEASKERCGTYADELGIEDWGRTQIARISRLITIWPSTIPQLRIQRRRENGLRPEQVRG